MSKRTKRRESANRHRRENRERHSPTHSPSNATGSSSAAGLERFRQSQLARLPQRLPIPAGKRLVSVYVEGYEDVSFWRGIFDDFETDDLMFEINVPPREDLAKGKKVLLGMLEQSSPECLLCVDSDFDYLFGSTTPQSQLVNDSPYLFHTYAYATENYVCYAPSLHNVCVKATKNDTRIFDFERFLHRYSQIIYPLFLWYAYSAQLRTENIFTLLDFKSSVKLNYLEVEDNGQGTLEWLARQVEKRQHILRRNHPECEEALPEFERQLTARGLTPEQTYLFMQGHTLMDNVVTVMLNAVCEQLKLISNTRISTSTKTGVALRNEMSNYNNALRNVRDILLDNEDYKECPLYKRLEEDIQRYLQQHFGITR